MEQDMTMRFLCELFFEDNNNIEVVENGMDPTDIWRNMRYKAFSDEIVPQIIGKLVGNNERIGTISYNRDTNRVVLTNEGRTWGNLNCRRLL